MNQRPIREFKAGTVRASVWPERAKRDERSWNTFVIQVQKVFYDPTDGQYRSTSYFRPDELPKLALVANEAFKFVSMRHEPGVGEPGDDQTKNPAAAPKPNDTAQ